MWKFSSQDGGISVLVDINWLFVIIKSYVKVNFKERNNNSNNCTAEIMVYLDEISHVVSSAHLRAERKI